LGWLLWWWQMRYEKGWIMSIFHCCYFWIKSAKTCNHVRSCKPIDLRSADLFGVLSGVRLCNSAVYGPHIICFVFGAWAVHWVDDGWYLFIFPRPRRGTQFSYLILYSHLYPDSHTCKLAFDGHSWCPIQRFCIRCGHLSQKGETTSSKRWWKLRPRSLLQLP